MKSNGNVNHDWGAMPDWITTSEAAQVSGYNIDYLRRLMRQGKITGEKKGLMWWIDLESLRAYVEEVEALGNRKFDPHRGTGTQAC